MCLLPNCANAWTCHCFKSVKCLKIPTCYKTCFTPKLCICFKNVQLMKSIFIKNFNLFICMGLVFKILLYKCNLNYSKLKYADGCLLFDLKWPMLTIIKDNHAHLAQTWQSVSGLGQITVWNFLPLY